MKSIKCLLLGLLVVSLGILTQCGDKSLVISTETENGFMNPPDEAKPRVWWHWMNGNITKDGIRKDLEWMERVGIGGFQNFDAAFMTPQIVGERLVYMTPEWKDAFRFTTELADSLGFEMAIAGSPGWSESGGPWVSAPEGMKKMVWSEIIVDGGEPFSGLLPHPPTVSGSFQNVPHSGQLSVSGDTVEIPEYYEDAAVIAYRIPEKEIPMRELNPRVTSSGGIFDLEMLTDGDMVTSSMLPSADNAWIQFEFDEPLEIYSVSMVGGGSTGMFGRGGSREGRVLGYSTDGENFEQIIDIPAGGVAQNTLTFPPVTAKYFRVSVITPPIQAPNNLSSLFEMNMGGNQNQRGTNIAELVLYTTPRINQFEAKAGYSTVTDVESMLTIEASGDEVINEAEVIDITDLMGSDGSLNWTPSEGRWNVIRMGYSLTGHENNPASPEATGLEVDKLNADHVRKYFTHYLDMYEDATGGLMGERGLQYVITDSWEAGTANWTDKMIGEFNSRNDYDITPWLPVLTGKIVGSGEASEKFLWDFRNTLGEMLTEYHYDGLTTILKERGMGRYTESHENQRAYIGDGMDVKRTADVPMSATWTPAVNGEIAVRHEADIRESASVAHIYGKKYVAAESLTAIGDAWAYSPERLKTTADFMLASGLNRFVIHTSVHQPVDDKIPGLGLGPFGQWFTRHETWAEQAGPWVDYLARSSYMLQQGNFVADIIYVYGEGKNLTALFGGEMPAIPGGFNYDFLNAGAVPDILTVKKNKIITGSGMEYNLMVLDESTRYMTLPVLKKISELVGAGAMIIGPRPLGTPSLNDNAEEFAAIVEQLWGNGDGITDFGKGRVYANGSIELALEDSGIEPDFMDIYGNAGNNLRFVHRSVGNQDIYWVSTPARESGSYTVSLRVDGKVPEIWDPVDGMISAVSYSIDNGRTEVELTMEPEDALFIVLRDKATVTTFQVDKPVETELEMVEGEWEVNFQPGRGAPERTVLTELIPWDKSENEGIRYFSGTAEYSKEIDVPEEWIMEGSRILIDLGNVKNIAEVMVNGTSLGVVWKKPFKFDITGALVGGKNQLQVKVTNLWVNRLIGDAQPEAEEKFTYTTMSFYQPDADLLESGLIGPVRIVSSE